MNFKMDGAKTKLFLVFLVSFGAIMPSLMAHMTHDDEVYWQRRSMEAWNNTLEAYHPNPEEVTNDLNKHANSALNDFWGEVTKATNSTRRELRGRKWGGGCLATNPIDRCWRCQANWAENRKRLADCAVGFGRGTTGGKAGEFYVVTDSSDDNVQDPKPGTLRHAVIQTQPLWIIFAQSMSIRLSQELIMTSHKTIDGRGVNLHITGGAGITIQNVQNVIIHGIHVHDITEGSGGLIRDSVEHFGFRTKSDGDGISLFGASNVWIDHVSMWKCYDGLIDAIEGSTAITISNGHFTDHNEVMLFGASDSSFKDASMQITVAFNHFGKRLVQRMPRCRFGFIHVVNNDYTHWNMYAIGGSQHPTIISQGNRFIAPPDIFKKEVTKRDYATEETWKSWDWRSEGDLFMNGAFFVQSGDPDYTRKHPQLFDHIAPAPSTDVAMMTRFAGSLRCTVGVPC